MIPIQTVQTGQLTMQYFRFGSGSRTMVILPGLSVQSVMGSADAVAAAYACFAAEYTVYLFDRRSDLPAKYPLADMAEDTAAAMQALGLSDAYVFGASQGGMMALLIAARHPELVKCAVLGSSAARINEHSALFLKKLRRAARRGDRHALVHGFAEAAYSEGFYAQYRAAFDQMAEAVTDEEIRRFLIIAGGSSADLTGELAAVQCPALVLGAGKDRVLGDKASPELAELLHAELYVYPNGSHTAYDEEPDYKERILAFFEAHP